MDIRSIRMLLGWSREELAERSGVASPSVYLLERMGTAGPKDDALIIRAMLQAYRRRPLKRLLGNDAVPLEHANDDAAVMPAAESRARPPDWRDGQLPTAQCGDMDQHQNLSDARPCTQATWSLTHEPRYSDGLSRR